MNAYIMQPRNTHASVLVWYIKLGWTEQTKPIKSYIRLRLYEVILYMTTTYFNKEWLGFNRGIPIACSLLEIVRKKWHWNAFCSDSYVDLDYTSYSFVSSHKSIASTGSKAGEVL